MTDAGDGHQYDVDDQKDLRPGLVAIGSSAGGFAALKEFFGAVPIDINAAFIVVQHLGSNFESNLAMFLKKVTNLKVVNAESGQRIVPGTIYLQPKGSTLLLDGEDIKLQSIDRTHSLQFPINGLFDSLAKISDRSTVGVVLSGTGSDGSRALPALQASGALIIAQSPESAEFSGMPQTAINTRSVDYVLAPDAMAEAIHSFIEFGEYLEPSPSDTEESAVHMLFDHLHDQMGVDFKHYKNTTLLRRIERRMSICQIHNIEKYVNLVINNPDELEWLARDLLIGVTSFFRDPAAFEALSRVITDRLKNEWREQSCVRIWVTSCSTGQEVYTVAIIVMETLEKLGIEKDIKIFATDADAIAVSKTSTGSYTSAELTEVSKDLRDKYFNPSEAGWTIKPTVREKVVVARHNLLKDPPFSNIDLVTCRNMLIYLLNDAQRSVIRSLHFSLRENGVIMLGQSENLRELESSFEPLDDKTKLFTNLNVGRLPLETIVVPIPNNTKRAVPMNLPRDNEESRVIRDIALEMLEQFTPPSILVDAEERIRHVFGDISAFTQPLKPGRFSPSLSNMVHQDLSVAVFTALQRCKESDETVIYHNITLKESGIRVSLSMIPYTHKQSGQQLFLAVFEDRTNEPQSRSPDTLDFDEIVQARERITHLEYEVQRQGENLLVTIEELETTNEELQNSNDELTIANEDLQSTNEELQSVNEELYSVNSEYEEKIRELSDVNLLLDQIIRSTAIGILMLDESCKIRSFTASIGQFIRLIESDVGRPLADIRHSLNYPDLLADVSEVLESSRVITKTVFSGEQLALIRITPYGEQTEKGAVITLTPIESELGLNPQKSP